MNLCHFTLLVTYHLLSSHAQFPNMVYPNPMPMGMPMSMPGMPLQMPIMGPPRLPSIVMPYHSKKADSFRKKPKRPRKRRPKHYESESYSTSSSGSGSSSSESSSSDEVVYRTKDGLKKRRQVLTPVISYVTKDGYVVYEKKIKKDRAKDWLDLGKNSGPNNVVQDEKDEELEDKIKEKLEKMTRRNSRSKRKHRHD